MTNRSHDPVNRRPILGIVYQKMAGFDLLLELHFCLSVSLLNQGPGGRCICWKLLSRIRSSYRLFFLGSRCKLIPNTNQRFCPLHAKFRRIRFFSLTVLMCIWEAGWLTTHDLEILANHQPWSFNWNTGHDVDYSWCDLYVYKSTKVYQWTPSDGSGSH